MRNGKVGRNWGPVKYKIPMGPAGEPMEPKHVAVKRLESEGRLKEFRKRRNEIHRQLGCRTDMPAEYLTVLFYTALREFPPLERRVL